VPQWMMVVENGGLRWMMVVGWGTAVDDGGWLGDCGGCWWLAGGLRWMMVVGWGTAVDDGGRKGTEVDGGSQCGTRVDDGSQWRIGVYDKL